ncbi:MAG TPA: hypothetical protein VF450_10405 [Noviherbaspirillum sp.]
MEKHGKTVGFLPTAVRDRPQRFMCGVTRSHASNTSHAAELSASTIPISAVLEPIRNKFPLIK